MDEQEQEELEGEEEEGEEQKEGRKEDLIRFGEKTMRGGRNKVQNG